jgi:large subunit ribosomal protein L25
MKERATLIADTRIVGDEKAKNLRKSGLIPAVIYGQGDNVHITVDNLSLRRVLKEAGTTTLIDVNYGDSTRTVVVKEVQSHVTRGDLIHVDFFEVDMQTKIVVDAELSPVGIAAPVTDGLGTTSLVIYSVTIECMPESLISKIEIDLSQIETPEDMIFVRDLEIPPGVEILTDPEAVIARFEYTAIEEEEEEIEEEDLLFAPSAEEVEVISKGKQAEEEEFEE